jgi:enoyl-CoA hydratase/carnithine racemase
MCPERVFPVSEGHVVLRVTVPEPHIAMLTLNRPSARNAVNAALASAMAAAVTQVENDPDIWAVILTGAGHGAFCAGADLKEVAAGQAAALGTEEGGFAGFVRYPRTKVWIAAAQSHALAGGLELILACDVVIAAESSTFGLPEVRWGLIAGGGGVTRLPRTIPKRIAFEMIATGKPIPAADAYHYGLVNAVVPTAEVVGAALEVARRICVNSPIAVRESMALARRCVEADEAELWALTASAMERLRVSTDMTEGARAFAEKRAPRWAGP